MTMVPRLRTALVVLSACAALTAACTDDVGDDPDRSTVPTDSTTPGAQDSGDDPDESRDNVDVDRDDTGAGSPFATNDDEGSNSGAGGG